MEKKNSAWQNKLRGFVGQFSLIIILVVIVTIAALINENFFTAKNLSNIVKQMTVVAIIACGETMILVLGEVDLSLGGMAALTGCIACGVMVRTQSMLLAILAALAVGAIIGFINGTVITKFKVPSFIITLAMSMITRGLALVYTGGIPIAGLGNLKVLGQGAIGGIPYQFAFLALIVAISYVMLNCTKLGRYIYAIGGNRSAADASGIKSNRVIITSFVLCSVLTAFAGVLLMARMNSGQPTGAEGYEFDAVTAAIVGGTSMAGGMGNIPGTLIGCFIISIITNILNLLNVSSFYQQIVKGIIIAGAVILDATTKNIKLKSL